MPLPFLQFAHDAEVGAAAPAATRVRLALAGRGHRRAGRGLGRGLMPPCQNPDPGSRSSLLVLYGVLPTWQTEPHIGRVYAAYGGVFVVLSLLWGRLFDGFEPDRWGAVGALVCLVGVGLIVFGPRGR